MINKNKEYLYLQLADNIKKKIYNGTYEIGSKIPSERSMASAYGITRLTVRRALNQLISEGILVANVGRGTYVAKIPENDKRINLGEGSSSRLILDIRSGGMNPSKIVVDMKKIDNKLELFPDEEKLFQLTRLMLIDDKPYAIQVANLPLSKFESIDRCDFKRESLYDYMDSEGHIPVRITSDLRIIDVPSEYIDYLKVRGDSKVFYFKYYGYDKNDELVEFTESYNLPQYTEYRFTIKRF